MSFVFGNDWVDLRFVDKELLEKEAKAGNARAGFQLFCLHRYGFGKTPINYRLACQALEGFPSDPVLAVTLLREKMFANPDNGPIIKHLAKTAGAYYLALIKRAETGEPGALVALANLQASGIGVSNDYESAHANLKIAAGSEIQNIEDALNSETVAAGHPVGRHALANFLKDTGSKFLKGDELKVAPIQFVLLEVAAAEAGVADAQNTIGNLYNIKRSEKEAFLIAASKFLNADKTEEESLALAEKYYLKAEENGMQSTIYTLGVLYNSLGNDIEAEKRFSKLASEGNRRAKLQLALIEWERNKFTNALKIYEDLANLEPTPQNEADIFEGLWGIAHINYTNSKNFVGSDKDAFTACFTMLAADSGRPLAQKRFAPEQHRSLIGMYEALVPRSWTLDEHGSLRHASVKDVPYTRPADLHLIFLPEDPQNHFQWLKNKIETDQAAGMTISRDLAIAYAEHFETGEGCDQDDAQAFHWYQVAADAGKIPTDKLKLFELLFAGIGCAEDWAEILREFKPLLDGLRGENKQKLRGVREQILAQAFSGRMWVEGAEGEGLRPAREGENLETARTLPSDPAAAQAFYEEAARNGSLAAAAILKERKRNSIVMPKDAEDVEAFENIFLASVDSEDDPEIHFALAECYARGLGTEADFVDARNHYETASRLGSIDAILVLAEAHLNGALNLPQDYAKALLACDDLADIELDEEQIQRRHAVIDAVETEARVEHTRLWIDTEEGLRPALEGEDLTNAQTVPGDPEDALRWYAGAARRGSAPAAAIAAPIFRERGEARQAVGMFLIAAKKSTAAEMLEIAGELSEILEDPEEALRLYRRSAQLGSISGMMETAHRCAEGIGGNVNESEALKWYRTAGDKGVVPAMLKVGEFLAAGRGTRADTDEAMNWYRRAADKGSLPAMLEMARAYHQGTSGYAEDWAQAWHWSNRLFVVLEKRQSTPVRQALLDQVKAIQTDIQTNGFSDKPRLWLRSAEDGIFRPARKNEDLASAYTLPRDPHEATDWLVERINEGSVPAAHAAAAIFDQIEDYESSFRILAHAAYDMSNPPAQLEVAERLLAGKGTLINYEESDDICRQLYAARDEVLSDNRIKHLERLRISLFEERWTIDDEGILRLAYKTGMKEPESLYDTSFFLDPYSEGIQALLEHEENSHDAAFGLAKRIHFGQGAPADRNDAFIRYSYLLVDRKIVPLQSGEEEDLGVLPVNSPLRERVQPLWDQLTVEVTFEGVPEGRAYRVRDSGEDAHPYVVPMATSDTFYQLISDGRRRAAAAKAQC